MDKEQQEAMEELARRHQSVMDQPDDYEHPEELTFHSGMTADEIRDKIYKLRDKARELHNKQQ